MGKSFRMGKSDPSNRDSGGFTAIPWAVIDSPAYRGLSMHTRAVLLELARQFVKDNNGRLLLSMNYMRKRGWNSASMLAKAKKELIESRLIYETVKGHRPNKASWYALTWHGLDKLKGYDEGSEACFVRSAYQNRQPAKINGLNP
jgi:hypothetical protein